MADRYCELFGTRSDSTTLPLTGGGGRELDNQWGETQIKKYYYIRFFLHIFPRAINFPSVTIITIIPPLLSLSDLAPNSLQCVSALQAFLHPLWCHNGVFSLRSRSKKANIILLSFFTVLIFIFVNWLFCCWRWQLEVIYTTATTSYNHATNLFN